GEVYPETGGEPVVDLRGRVDDTSFVVEVTVTSRRGIEEMEGRLAKAILQMRKAGNSHDLRLVLLRVPRIGRRAVSQLEDFMDEYGPEFGWGVFDDQGTVRLLVRALEVDVTKWGDYSPSDSRKTTHNKRAFTDLNRWLLKVLTLRDAPEAQWYDEEKYRRDIESPAELHRVADVSQAKAYQFARTFRDLGLLKWDRGEFRVSERRRLFERWYNNEQQLRVDRFPVRPLFPDTESATDVFADADETVDYAVGGFEACRMYDVLHTKFNEPEIHVFQNPGVICEQLDLEECADHEAELYLLQVPYEQSVRRGTREVEGLKVVDILQAALDTARHAARGREQAEYIVEHVLGWS
ncbi:MAG: hypothetical protein ABEN55_13650, partial [Bradymonadaceae bacterium]